MMTRRTATQRRLAFVDLEELVPRDHLLRQIQETIDFSFIYDKVKHLYSENNGRPSIDPVLLFKMTLIGYLYGIPSERRLEQEVKLNLAYRWFLGLEIDDPVPDHSIFSKNRRRRFSQAGLFQQIFDHIVGVCIQRGLVSGEWVVIDSTHVKANAAAGKNDGTVRVRRAPSEYIKELDREAARWEAEQRGEKGSEGKGQGGGGSAEPEVREVRVNKHDPDARWMNRVGKPKGYHYLAHQIVDTQCGIILDAHVTAGNVNDHEPCPQRLWRVTKRFGLKIQGAAMDSGYDEISVHRKLNQLGIQGYIPRKVKQTRAKTFRTREFTYVHEEDHYRCPGGKTLTFARVARIGTPQKVYKAQAADCKACSLREQCVPQGLRAKQITRPLFQDDADLTHSRIGTEAFRMAQRLRRIWSEGTFGTQKLRHNLSHARMRGRERMREQSLMSAIAMNVKRMVKAQLQGRMQVPVQAS